MTLSLPPVLAADPVSNASSLDNTLFKSGLKLSHLRMIVALEDTGQISAAAALMTMSQPAASRMLTEMAAILNAELYERVPKGVVLTRYGEALARRARTILLELREANREIAELKTGSGGSIHLGAVQAAAISRAVPAISRVSAAYPGIEINLSVETSNVLGRELLSAKHDFIVGRIPDDLNPRLFQSRELGLERACLIVRENHPLLGGEPVTLADLPHYRWVFQPPGTLLRRTVEDLFINAGVALPENQVNTSSALLTVAIVTQSDAIAPVSMDMAHFVAALGSQAGKVRILPTRFDIVVKPYSLITAKGRDLPPSAQLLYDIILNQTPQTDVFSSLG